MEIPSTFERHRRYRLRRQRMQRLRRRTAVAMTAVSILFVAWHLLARLGPEPIAPPSPASLGSDAARSIARRTVASVNRVHAELYPGHREDAKRQVLRLLSPRSDVRSSGGHPVIDTPVARPELPGARPDVSGTWGALPPAMRVLPPAMRALPPALANPAFFADEGTAQPFGMTVGPGLPPAGHFASTTARTMDILLIGLDSRLGHRRGRADALHLLTLDFDAPRFLITSIPRGTHSPLGYRNAASNIIANVRAARGRTELQRRIARLCGRDSVPYYVEVGFSDAYGILELIGSGDPAAALQALRRRKGYQYGDHDRCYNQGCFVRTAMLRMLPLLEGATGDLLLRAGLELMRTNLTLEQCRGIVYLLNDAGVPDSPELVDVTLRSPFRHRIERRGPDPSITFRTTEPARVQAGAPSDRGGEVPGRAETRIRRALSEAARRVDDDRAVRTLLWTMFSQHAWMQMPRGAARRELRDSLATVLGAACMRLGDSTGRAVIDRTVRADELLFPARP